jgi:hypothetical protein
MNKNLALAMLPNLSMLFDVDPAGGGTATAPAVAAPTPAAPAAPAASAAPAAPAAAPKGGAANLFNGIRHQKPPEKKEPVAAAPAATPKPGEVAAPAAPAAAKPGEPAAAAPAIDAEKLARPVMGRFNTIKEVEEAMKRSQDEGLRLYNENKTLSEKVQKDLSERDSQIASLKAELETVKTHGVFQELSKEELDLLRKDNPGGYTDYLRAKDQRDQALASEKAKRESETRNRQEYLKQARETVLKRDSEMRANKAEYPGYEEQIPIMDQIIGLTTPEGGISPVTGYPWSSELLFYAAKGHAAVQAERAGAKAKEEAAREAAATAAATATATGAPAGGNQSGAPLAPVDDNKAYKESVLRAAPRRVFGGK